MGFNSRAGPYTGFGLLSDFRLCSCDISVLLNRECLSFECV